jgi:hypothetical protein
VIIAGTMTGGATNMGTGTSARIGIVAGTATTTEIGIVITTVTAGTTDPA